MNVIKKITLRGASVRAFLFSFAAVAMVGVIIHPSAAQAKWTRTHASQCMTLDGTAYDTSYAIWNNSTTKPLVLLCAVSDTDYLAKGSLTALNIHGKDGHPRANVDAMACYSAWWITGGACSPVVSSVSGTFDYMLSPSLAVWSGVTADFGYVWVRLPVKASGGARSSLRGFYTAN